MEQLMASPRSADDPVATLYAAHSARLRRIVRSGIRTQEAVVEDACQVAWSRLIPRVSTVNPEARLSWLVTTASREAIKLTRRAERDVSLEVLSDAEVELPVAAGPEETVALRERLHGVRALPLRQQQLVWLAGLGLNYEEMANYTRSSRRTVERQLLRAKHALRDAA
jgi:RNA polymerase sigma factor (sigma-70 family)